MKVFDLERESDFGQKGLAHHFQNVLLDHPKKLLLVVGDVSELGEDFCENVAIFKPDHWYFMVSFEDAV